MTFYTELLSARLSKRHIQILDEFAKVNELPNRTEALRRILDSVGDAQSGPKTQVPAKVYEKPSVSSRSKTLVLDDDDVRDWGSVADEP